MKSPRSALLKNLTLGIFLLLSSSHVLAMTGDSLATTPEYAAVVRINLCSAVFLTKRLLVTAAHCIDQNSDPTLEIRKNSRNGAPITVRVRRARAHPDYSDRYYDRDIGYLLLEEDIDDPEIVGHLPVLAPAPEIGATITEVGVGTRRQSSLEGMEDPLSEEKKKKVESILADKRGSLLIMNPSTEGLTHCSGDSGGGLFFSAPGENPKLIGLITSHNDTACGAPDFISYGENLAIWRQWLESETGIPLGSEQVR